MTRIAQSFTVGFPRADVWRMLADVERVVTCMPGASLTRPPEGGKLLGEMRVKLGPIVAAFAGEGELVMNDATHTGTIRGQGMDRKNNSRVRAEVEFKVLEAGDKTRVEIAVDFSLTGTLAQFSRGALIEEIARRLGAEFARNLEARLASAAAARAGQPAEIPATAGEALNAGALAWALIRDWIRSLFARVFGGGDRKA
ncbi:MAG: SRPBCC family protein [Pseudomonadota bacterium]